MRVLVISKEAWRDEQNGGNVLTNIFSQLPNIEFAQIYCNEQEPNNTICKNYYQICDKMMVNNILHGTKVGKRLNYKYPPTNSIAKKESFKDATSILGGNIKRIARELVWYIGRWDTNDIISYAKEFNPKIIFAPCYGNHYMQNLTILLHNALNIPVISYISDDFYTNKQFKISPLFWLNHFLLRRKTQEVFKHYSLVYTMTDEQKIQCEKDFGAKMKILRKGGLFNQDFKKASVNKPIRIIYAGGIYLNRWKTLCRLVNALRKINRDEIKFILDIYTNNPLNKKMEKSINDGINSKVHNSVSSIELKEIYRKSDIALHVESFDLINRHVVRMSFSTKIVDCLDSGCAVMAICDKKQAGGAYLKRNKCAICINKLSDIEQTLKEIYDNPQILIDIQHKAFDIGRKYHLQKNITESLINDFTILGK